MHELPDGRDALERNLHTVFKHKYPLAAVFLAVVTVIALGSFLMTPMYRSSGRILVKLGKENFYTPSTGNQPVVDTAAREERINSESEMLKGRMLAEKVLADIGIGQIYPGINRKGLLGEIGFGQPLSELQKALLLFQRNLSAHAIRKSNIIEVQFDHPDPKMAALVVNKVVDAFIQHHIDVYRQPENYDFFSKQVQLMEKRVSDSQKELQTFKNQYNISAIGEQKAVLLRQISDMEIDLAKTRAARDENRGKRASMDEGSGQEASRRFGKETDTNAQAISNLKSVLATLRLREGELRSKYTDKNALVVGIQEEIRKVERMLAAEEKTYHDKEINSIDHSIGALRGKEGAQSAHLGRYKAELRQINSTEIRLRELERKLKLDEENYQLYLKKMEEGRIADAMDSQKMVSIGVVDPALPPVTPVRPKTQLNILVALFLGGFASTGLVLVLKYFDRTFSSEEEIERELGHRVLGSVPYLKR